jgi:hypothetical protein
MKRYKSLKEGGLSTLPKFTDKIITVDQKDSKGRNIYNLIYDKLQTDKNAHKKFPKSELSGGDFEVYDFGDFYKVSIIDWNSHSYKSLGTIDYKK